MSSSGDRERALPAYLTPVHGRSFGSYVGRGLRARRRAGIQPHELDRELQDFLVEDDHGVVGIVDEVRADGTMLLACGWFGKRHVVLRLDDIAEVHSAERRLVLRSGLAPVEELRAEGGAFARLMAALVGRSLARPRQARARRRSH